MADVQTVIGLLYRADWTRLSLSADVRTERDGDLALRRLRAMRPAGFRPGPTMRLRRTAGAVSATRSFLDDLRGGRPPASG
jgi:hypothetical protein